MVPPISRYMTACPIVISPSATLREAAAEMEKHNVRHLPVSVENRVAGVISSRDVEIALAIYDNANMSVGAVMGRFVYTVALDAPLDTALWEMSHRKYGSAVVVDKKGAPVGIFTSVDAMELLSQLIQTSATPVDLAGCIWPNGR